MERAQDEVKASRAYIAGLEKQVESKQTIIDAQAKRQTLSDEAIASLQKEVEILQNLISAQEKAIEKQTAEIKSLRKDRDKANKKLSRSRKVQKFLIVGIGVFVISTILK